MKKLATAVIFGLLMVNISVSAQNLKKGKFGLGIDGVETTTRFAAKYYLSDKFAVEAIGWFDMISPKENTPAGQIKVEGVNYVAGLDALYHFNMDNFAPYIGVEALFISDKPGGFYVSEPGVKNSLQSGIVLGTEYFISDHFSIGLKEKIDTEFGLSRSAKDEISKWHFSTKGEITGRFYF